VIEDKKPGRNPKRSRVYGIIKQFMILFLPLLILGSFVFGAFLLQERKTKRKILLYKEQQNVELIQRIAVGNLRSIVMDLTSFTALPALRQMIERDEAIDHIELSRVFLDFCKSSDLYAHVRFLDETGMEIIRVNFNEGHPGIVPKAQLQNKSKRYYFADTIELEPGQIFVSPLDLNVEQGQIEDPLKPMIRFGAPIVDLNGQKQGVVLLNYFGAKIIGNLNEASLGTIGKFMLLNSHGYWLKGLDPKDEWGFMYDDRKDRTLATYDSDGWEKIATNESGQFTNKKGVYTFTTIHPIVRGMISSTGSAGPFNASKKRYSSDEYYWKVVSFIPSDILHEQLALVHSRWILAYVLTLVLLGLFSWFLSSNIVRRKQAESAEKEKAMYLSNILTSSTEYAIATTDLDFVITYYNPMAEKLFGYTAIEVIGKTVQEIHTKENVAPERLEEAIKQVLKTGKYEYLLVNERDEGTSYISSQVTGIYNNDSELVGYALFSKDDTERIMAKTVLQESEYQLRQIIDLVPHFIFVKDETGKFEIVNKAVAEAFGTTVEDLTGRRDSEFVATEEENEHFRSDDLEVIKSGKSKFIPEEELTDSENNIRYLQTTKVPFKSSTTKKPALLGVAVDITKRKQAEMAREKLQIQLTQAQKIESIGTLAGGIAHDFNNILYPILGYTEMLLEDIPEDSPLRNNLDAIYTGSLRARDLVKQILTFSRQAEHEMKPLRVQLVIKEALKLLRSSLPATIDIRQDMSNECGLVIANPTQIHQIVMNLCINAFHAMEDTGGTLTVSLKETELSAEDLIKDQTIIPGLYVRLTVADTGPGMEQRIINRIFDPYFTTKEKGKGTGLGLAVVHGIVKSHGGYINTYSELGKGTEFKVYLPVTTPRETVKKNGNGSAIQKGNERVLLVDDEDIIVQMTKQVLERLGYHVTTRNSSKDALEAFRVNPEKFDLVITDLTMPNMTGDKLTVELIKIRSNIPVILCTGFSEKMSDEKATSFGIKGFLMKPIVMKELAKKIREVLDDKENSDKG